MRRKDKVEGDYDKEKENKKMDDIRRYYNNYKKTNIIQKTYHTNYCEIRKYRGNSLD